MTPMKWKISGGATDPAVEAIIDWHNDVMQELGRGAFEEVFEIREANQF